MTVRFWLIGIAASIVFVICVSGCEEKPAAVGSPAETLEKAQAEQKVTAEKTPTAETEQLAAKIEIKDSVYDFGEIDPGSTNRGVFKFKNTGEGVLKISRIKSTCGCTVPRLKKKEYLPEESGEIKVAFKPGQRSGKQNKHLYVISNDPKTPKAQLTIRANVTQKVAYEPKRLKIKLNKENGGIGQVTIRSLDGKAFSITKVRARPDIMKVDYDPAAENTSYVVKPKVDMEKLAGKTTANLTITLNHPSQKLVSIPVDILQKYKTDPSTLIALNIKPGESVRKTLYVMNNYGDDFTLSSVTADTDSIKIVSQKKLEDKYVIDVDISAPEGSDTRRSFTGKLDIRTGDGETIQIRCVGSVARQKTIKK